MDRYDFYFRQLVGESDLDNAYADAENAIWNLAADFSFFGIITGAVASEHSPKNLTIDLSAPGVGYDQQGRRVRFGSIQNVDMSVDKDGVSTAVSAPGNTKYLSVQMVFDRLLSDPRTDGNGLTVYYRRQESFRIDVVQGSEAVTPTPPTKPSDGMLVCDVLIAFGQTQIQNSDIDTARRDDFVTFPASTISVSSGSWTILSPATDTVQATFDDIDGRIPKLDASDNLVPRTPATDTLGDPGAIWIKCYLFEVLAADVVPLGAGSRALGTTSNRWYNAYLDELSMYGNILTDGTSRTLGATGAGNDFNAYLKAVVQSGDINTDGTARTIGTTGAGNRFNIHTEKIYPADNIEPSNATVEAGTASNPFEQVRSNHFTSYEGTPNGAFVHSAALTGLGRTLTLHKGSDDTAIWLYQEFANVGSRNVYNFFESRKTSSSVTFAYFDLLGLIDGTTFQTLRFTYYIDLLSGATISTYLLQVLLYYKDKQGTKTDIGTTGTFSTTGSWQDDVVCRSSLAHTVNLEDNTYHLAVAGAAPEATGSGEEVRCYLPHWRAVYDATDVGVAALGQTYST